MGAHGTLAPGEWICTDQNAAELLLMGERGTSTITNLGKSFVGESGKGTLYLRSGAIGDLLLLSPALKAMRQEFPNAHLSLCCFPKHFEVVADLDIDLIQYPLPHELAGRYGHILSLEDTMEVDHTQHATDIFAKEIGVKVQDYQPVYAVSELEHAWALSEKPRGTRKRVGIQPAASVANRDYSLPHWLTVIERLIYRENCEVLLFGRKGQIPPLRLSGPVYNLSEKEYTFRQSAALLNTCDVFCGVDSSLLHLCHALGKPAVGLFAAFDWKTRTAKAPLTWALTGIGDCAPCSWHKHAGHAFPPDKPCARLRNCHVLASIEPDRIVSKILSLPCK